MELATVLNWKDRREGRRAPRLPRSVFADGSVLLKSGHTILFDPDLADIVANIPLFVSFSRGGRPYARTVHDGRAVPIHRLIVDAPIGADVDHSDGNTLNNRRLNLRVCSRGENNWNMAINRTNKSGFKGVTKYLHYGFRATASLNNQRHYLGTFPTPEEAARVYDDFARRHFGAFACLNFPLHGEQSVHRGAVS